jgi:hypothetical protein
MKKSIPILLLLLLLVGSADAAKLNRIRFGYFPEKIRVVLDFDDNFNYTLEESKEKVTIHLSKVEAASEISNYIELSDVIIHYLEVERENDGLKITIPLGEPLPYNIFALNDPYRLVVDFNREFTNLVSGGTIIDGAEYFKVTKGSDSGRVNANVIKVDPAKAEVLPALARKGKPNLLDSFIKVFTPWRKIDDNEHFLRAKVGEIAEDQGAVAAVNGTYFAFTVKQLGTLLIDKERVSTPIYD